MGFFFFLIEAFFDGRKITVTECLCLASQEGELQGLLGSFSVGMMYKLKLSDLTSLALQHHQEMFIACWATAQGTGKSRGRMRRVGGGGDTC